MRHRALYDRLCIYVCPDSLTANDFAVLECCVRDGGASLAPTALAPAVTHVVCHPSEYQRFVSGRRERFYEIVRPEWVYRSFLLQKCIPVDKFSANPSLFFSTLAIAAGTIDKDPRKVIDGLIAHFGGQIIDDTADSSGATHVLSADGVAATTTGSEAQRAFQVAFTDADVERQVELWKQWLDDRPATLDFSIPGCVVAFLGKGAGLDAIHYVNYAWIEECVRRKQRVPETQFTKDSRAHADSTLPNWKSRPDVKIEELTLDAVASVYDGSSASQICVEAELGVVKKVSADRLTAMQHTLGGAIVLLAQHIPTPLKDVLVETLKAAKAKVATVPLGETYGDVVRKVVTNASFVICRYESGLEYEEATRQKKQVKSVFWALAGVGFQADGGSLRDALMCPLKGIGGVTGMESFVITLSGFSSRTLPTRDDVQTAIQATGACVLPVLSRSHSTHLLCFEAKGEKFKKAQSWNFENILSHEWLLECLQQWKYVPEAAFRMSDEPISKPTAIQAKQDAHNTSELPNVAPSSANGAGDAKLSTRFDVEDILDELEEPAPKPKRGRSAGKLDAAAEAASKLLDTPMNGGSRSTRRSSTDQDTASAPVPDDFEFQFGKTAKAKGKSKAAVSRVKFEDQKKAKAKEQLPAADQKDATVPSTKTSTKKTTTAQKRKSTDSTTDTAETTTSTGRANSTKKKKTTTDQAPVLAAQGGDSSSRLFLLTGSREECAINESIILSLGGSVSQIGRIYDPLATHIICNELKRTEKFVAGCAAGKWILKQSYLTACADAQAFVDEAAHEWGADERDPDNMDPRIWPPAPAFWRAARAAQKPGAFAGWRFLVHAKAVPPADMCERVIQASDGELLPLDQEEEWIRAAASATKARPVFALIHAELSHRDPWMKKFKTHKVRCLNASFLIDYLTKDQTNRPRIEDYVL